MQDILISNGNILHLYVNLTSNKCNNTFRVNKSEEVIPNLKKMYRKKQHSSAHSKCYCTKYEKVYIIYTTIELLSSAK